MTRRIHLLATALVAATLSIGLSPAAASNARDGPDPKH